MRTSTEQAQTFAGSFRYRLPQISRCLPQLPAVATGTLKLWVIGNYRVAAILADEPSWPLQHRSGLITKHAIGTVGNLLIHVCGFPSTKYSIPTIPV
jgi:hypothetical protein